MSQESVDIIAKIEPLVRAAGDKLHELWPGRNTGRELQIQRKPDGTMVTEADFASHKIISEGLAQMFPEDFIFSEEDADTVGFAKAKSSWILDPLDGTEIFSRGLDYFAIFLARRIGDEITEGVMYYPALGQFFAAQKGRGATFNGSPLKVSSHAKKLKPQSIFVEAVSLAPAPYLCDSGEYPVCTTGFCALARGDLDGVIVRFTSGYFYPWDFAPGMLIIQESGGQVTDEHGKPIVMNHSPIDCRYMVASNKALHEKVLEVVPK